MTTGDDDSIEARLAKADRAIERAALEEKIRKLGGMVGRPAGNNDDTSEMELEFLKQVMAWETGPFSTHAEWLARRGLVFAAPEELRGPRLPAELGRLIEALAVARVFLCHTDHLSDAELYARLCHEVLKDEAPDFARTPADACHWDFAEAGTDGETAWLTFYATEDEREEWRDNFPDIVLPPHQSARYRRDHRLPQRD